MSDTNKKTPTAEERLAALEERLQAADKKQADQDKALAKMAKENDSLKAGLKASATPEKEVELVLPTQTFKVGGKEYKFASKKFILDKVEMTAIDALSDKDVLKKLVDKGSGVIVEVE